MLEVTVNCLVYIERFGDLFWKLNFSIDNNQNLSPYSLVNKLFCYSLWKLICRGYFQLYFRLDFLV